VSHDVRKKLSYSALQELDHLGLCVVKRWDWEEPPAGVEVAMSLGGVPSPVALDE
jgi:hypothetical protein